MLFHDSISLLIHYKIKLNCYLTPEPRNQKHFLEKIPEKHAVSSDTGDTLESLNGSTCHLIPLTTGCQPRVPAWLPKYLYLTLGYHKSRQYNDT
jgi:hypothetical protein